jgi:hypothetical protein
MNLSDLLRECWVYTAEQSTLDLLPPKQPAVYAFYELFRFTEVSLIDEIDKYKTRYARTIALEMDDLPDRLHIKMRGNPERFKGEGLALCKRADAARLPGLCRTLMFLSLVNEPLYVGKTNDIRVRFRAHHDTDFLFMMKERFKRSPDEFLLFAYFCADEDSRLLESILIQLINPPYCEQKT